MAFISLLINLYMDELNKKIRVAIYVRVSTEEQVSKGVSIEHQKESLVEYVNGNSNYIINENRHIYIDRWFSGASMNRPALQKLMFDAWNREFDLVLVKKVDRFFRKNLYLLQHVDELVQNGVWFKAVDQWFNIEDTSGKMMLSMLGVIWEMERDLIRDRTISGKIQKAKMWYYVWGWYAKMWYSLEHDGRGNKLIINEEEATTVRRIFQLYVDEGKSFWEISRILNSEWVRTKFDLLYKDTKSDRRKMTNFWYGACLGKIIEDEMYIGNYYYGKHTKKFDKKSGKDIWGKKPRDEWLALNCPKIIDDMTYIKAQEILKKNKMTKNNKKPHIFAGLVRCDVCWRGYVATKTSKWSMIYRCWWYPLGKNPQERRCYNKQVTEKYLLDNIWNKIELVFRNPKNTLESYYNSKNQNDIFDWYKWELDGIVKKIEKYSNGLRNLYKDMYLTDIDIEKELKQDAIQTMEKELGTLNNRKIELNAHLIRLKQIDENKDNLKKIIQNYKHKFKNIDEQSKIELIQEFVEKIVVYENGKIIVYFRFEDNWGWDENGGWWWDDTDTLGERGWINGADQIKSDNAHPHNSPDYDWNDVWQVKTSNAMVTAFSYKISNNPFTYLEFEIRGDKEISNLLKRSISNNGYASF